MIDLQALRKIRRSLRLMDYYFLRQPYYSLWRTDEAYRRMRALGARKIEKGRVEKVAQNLKTILGQELDDEAIEGLPRKYFEVLSCDDLDAWLWLLKPWIQRRKHIVVEDEQYFREVADQKKAVSCLARISEAVFLSLRL